MTASQPDMTTTAGKLADLAQRLENAARPVGAEAVDKRHEAGQLTARERAERLLDADSFVETDALARHRVSDFDLEHNKPLTDGVVTGYGTIGGRRVCVYSQDNTVFSGQLGEVYGEKICKIYQLATKTGQPIIAIHEGTGPRFAEGIVTLAMYSKILSHMTAASGVIPQISVVTGQTTGLHAFGPAFSDVTIMVDGDASLHHASEAAIAHATGTRLDTQALGSAQVHATESGTCHLRAESDAQALELARTVVDYLPVNNMAEALRTEAEIQVGSVQDNVTDTDYQLDDLIPDDTFAAYDVREVLNIITDDGIFELQEEYAPNIVTAFAHVEGRAVGIIANQSAHQSGALTSRAAEKAARFIRTCDAFNTPIIEFVDSADFVHSADEERAGLLRRGAKLAYAYAEATVPKVTVILRKAFGTSYVFMGSKELGADLVYAWPTAQIAIAGAEETARGIYGAQFEGAADGAESLAEKAAELEEKFIHPYAAAERGYVDAVIPPNETRGQLVEALRMLGRKVVTTQPKKHGNIAL
ncbi:acyl-CoA carboxylase subunit beta [Corynebacterium pseudodiphtheriticum]|uniref:acyl-CoA carboxylase subunit beta n=1 Tax=Corynebacterium pseudodiphtheriticum TaxID=37637 RepID=UPI002540C855|nr:acyl-CoA carboxylase subunit beta [Corynebacterium pseudodiphtheriticum]MDK4285126.1 acyl-CoA carboxylase subunit beta [Corynebacterium pseudodiphtheriticum]MDK4315002.1 acyl-CoA carboxylase subunit beta [Corynebacterium pseudodiphtheriticum]